MGEIEFVQLADIEEELIIALMTNKMVGKQLPLLSGGFSSDDCQAFLAAKQRLWDEYGFGPWAFRIKGEFAGWGGLQPENGEADFALVLHPDFWGWGKKIFDKVKLWAFDKKDIASITILFPPSRLNFKAITRLGFTADGHVTIDTEQFMRFQLVKG